jgi:hypothetical protein
MKWTKTECASLTLGVALLFVTACGTETTFEEGDTTDTEALVPSCSSEGEGEGEDDKEKVPVCHATGSMKNPYVLIHVARSAVAAHARHQNGRDLIPAPKEGCPEKVEDDCGR